MKHRLRKKDRVAVAGKHNRKAVYIGGRAKRKWILWRAKHGIKGHA